MPAASQSWGERRAPVDQATLQVAIARSHALDQGLHLCAIHGAQRISQWQ
jgi:hypothetical protein